jgi:hypothetical protein
MKRGVSAGEVVAASVEVVDARTGRLVGVLLDDSRVQVVAPDRITGRGVTVTEFDLDEVVLAGPVARPVRGRRGAWVLTRAVRIDDPDWGGVAPAWSWLFVPDDSKASRRSGERFQADLRRALPRARWAKGVKLSKDVRRGVDDPGAELLALASRRDPAFAEACSAVDEARTREAAGLAERAELVLLDSLHWRGSAGVTTVTP